MSSRSLEVTFGSDVKWEKFVEKAEPDLTCMRSMSHCMEQYACDEIGITPDGIHGRCHLRYANKPCVQKQAVHCEPGVIGHAAFWGRVIHLLKAGPMQRVRDTSMRSAWPKMFGSSVLIPMPTLTLSGFAS